MTTTSKIAALCGAAGIALFAISGTAAADGYEYSAPAAEAVDEGRKFTYSFNLGVVSDYIYRGFSQSDRDPVMQGGIDVAYGIAYLGWWASGIDFGNGPDGVGGDAEVEMNLYGGFKPTWGQYEFDFGVIYYFYPGASDAQGELDFVEFKAGVSTTFHEKLSTGLTVFWTPEYTGETGSVWTLEGAAGYEFNKVWVFTPSLTGTLGWQIGDNTAWESTFGNGRDNYLYWNAGIELAVEKLTFDFRYWDTNVSNSGGFCDGPFFQCGSAFVFSAKVELP